MAGLGKINKEAPHGYYDKAYGFYDVVVVGGGPAGMCAAIEAGKAGLDVLLLDEWPMLGGSLAYARFGADWPHNYCASRECAALAIVREAWLP